MNKNYLKLIFICSLFSKYYVSGELRIEDSKIQDNNIDKIDVKNKSKQLLLFSSLSAIPTSKTLIDDILAKNNVTTVLFIPYAHFNYNNSAAMYSRHLEKFGYAVESIHIKNDPIDAIRKAQAIFIGGGNTFVLLKTLYDEKLIEPIREQVLQNGIPYIGSSAGTNVATRSIHTTNDMPIVYPPSFKGLNFLPFNINPHFNDQYTLLAEPRIEKLYEFLLFNNGSVLGMRNGNILSVKGNIIKLVGSENATLLDSFTDTDRVDYEQGSDLSFLSQLEDL